jgi:cyclophilin family peptidyl-prolyl cis-trans isomerase
MISISLGDSHILRKTVVLVGLLLAASAAQAVPPAAATNVKAFASKRTIGTDRVTYYHVTWEDNALDEAGYLVKGRVLSGGRPVTGYFNWANEPANSTNAIVTLGDVDPAFTLQFQVVAFKQNGNQIETRPSANQATVRVPSTDRWAAPTNLIMTNIDDGTIKATWDDNSDTEIRFELLVREAGTTPWFLAADPLLGQKEIVMRLGLKPATAYEWAIRALRFNVFEVLSERLPPEPNLVPVPLTLPPLTPPTNLVATIVGADRVRLAWADNSVNAMGYAIQFRFVGETSFQTLTYAGGNDTSFETSVGPGTQIEWQVAAAYQAQRAEGQTEAPPIVTSAPSNLQLTDIPAVPNPGPTQFAAAATALAGSVAVRWTNIDDEATQVRVLARVAGSSDAYSTLTTVAADRHHVLLTNLPIGVAREFAVVALGPNGTSDLSTTVEVTPGNGFDPAWYRANLDPVQFGTVTLTPLVVAVEDDPETPLEDETQIVANEAVRGQAFSHQLKVTNESNRESWAVTDLPMGMSPFNDATDLVEGTPSQAGLFNALLSLTYVGEAAKTAKLVFRVREPAGAPAIVQTLADRTVGLGSLNLNLNEFFTDPDTPKAARIDTTLGNIDLALYENVTPQHVQNFLAYATAGDYNGVAFHRALPGFVVQVGGFKPTAAPNIFTTVTKRTSPFNEPGLANVRGTIAAAKLGDDPDSATHDFFLNLNDNRTNLDNQNSGFTVFGRVTGTGMAVVDAIAALPRRTYSLVIDGADGSLSDFPMNATTAPATMDIAQTIKIDSATEITPLTYSVTSNSNPAALSAVVENGQLQMTGLSGGVAEITVTATDLDGQVTPQTFEVTVDGNISNPLIVSATGSQILPVGSTATFSVVAQGTDLVFAWRKDGVLIPNEQSNQLVLLDIDDDDAGVYDVVVSNSVKSVTSAPATLTIAKAPIIAAQPSSVILRSGTALTLTSGAMGAPTPTLAWTKNGTVVSGATQAVLSVPTAALSDAGVYRLKATNDTSTVESNPAEVIVVDGSARFVSVRSGGNVVLQVAVAKPASVDLGFLWRRNGVALAQNNKYAGVNTPRLTIRGLGQVDAGTYTCDVIAPRVIGTVVSGNFNVVAALEPELATALTLPTAFVGRDFEFTLPQPALESSPRRATRFTVSGLPPGIRLDGATGRLVGRPTRPGTFNLRIRGFNAAGGGNTVSTNLQVIPLAAPTVGSHTGLLARQAVINKNGGGVMTVTVTDNGAFSGNVIVPGARYVVRGTVNRGTNGVVTGASAVPRSGADPLAFDFSINPNTGYSTGNLRLNQTTNSEIIGWKDVWHATYNPTVNAGYVLPNNSSRLYTMSMTPAPGGQVTVPIPNGLGFAAVTVTNAGRVTVSGRTVDGQPLLFSGPLSANGEFFVYQPLDQNTGSVLGPLRILPVDEDTNGTNEIRIQRLQGIGFDQFKDVRPAGERLYPAGFGLLDLTVRGGPYVAPTAPNLRILGLLSDSQQASLRFFDGGVPESATQPSVLFGLTNRNQAILPQSNPAGVSWKVNASTGLFSGKFTLADGAVRRTVNYFGQLVPVTPTRVKGVGSFQLPQLPTGQQTLQTSPILTGRVDLQPNPPVD